VPAVSHLFFEMPENKKQSTAVTLQPFVCGGVSACFASAVIHPVDLIKVRMQLLGQGSKAAIPSPFKVATDILKQEGVSGLYSGLTASLTRQATYGTARIGLHRSFSDALKTYNKGQEIPFWQKTVSGMGSGALAVCIGTPFDVALVRMQNDSSLPQAERRGYTNVFNALARISSEEGIGNLWRGLAPNILRGMSMNVGMMACYDQAKGMMVALNKDPNPDSPSLKTKLGSAAVAGFCCAFMSLPFDMIKSRLQNMKPDSKGVMPYNGVMDCGSKILTKEGPLAFWRGFSAYYFRCAPHAMIILLSIEQVTQMYRGYFVGEEQDAEDRRKLNISAAQVIPFDGAGIRTSFFALKKENEALEAEVKSLRMRLHAKESMLDRAKLADGRVFDVDARIVAINESHRGHYKAGDTGRIVELGSGANSDPVVLWDHSGKQLQTSRLKIKASDSLTLSDGVNVAVGLPVVAVERSAWGHYSEGATGVITKVNPTDPVVKWDHSGEEHQTSRGKLSVSMDKIEK